MYLTEYNIKLKRLSSETEINAVHNVPEKFIPEDDQNVLVYLLNHL